MGSLFARSNVEQNSIDTSHTQHTHTPTHACACARVRSYVHSRDLRETPVHTPTKRMGAPWPPVRAASRRQPKEWDSVGMAGREFCCRLSSQLNSLGESAKKTDVLVALHVHAVHPASTTSISKPTSVLRHADVWRAHKLPGTFRTSDQRALL